MMDKVKFRIEENEWAELDRQKRKRILTLMNEYGYDTTMLEVLERECIEPTIEEIYRQFYGDEE